MADNQNTQAPAANVVTVTPGGATFPTINAALASIKDANLKKQYLVEAGPGTYSEQVVLKPYVYLRGAGPDQTVLTTAPVKGDNFFNRGTIIGAGNSTVAGLTANCLGGSWGDYSTALLLPACTSFMA